MIKNKETFFSVNRRKKLTLLRKDTATRRLNCVTNSNTIEHNVDIQHRNTLEPHAEVEESQNLTKTITI